MPLQSTCKYTWINFVMCLGDRLTDERIQAAQQSMANADTAIDCLEGFISKIEDFHRLMNFLEVICKLTYDTASSRDRGSVAYSRNFLNSRDVKGPVKSSYRPHTFLLYTIFDAMYCMLFFKELDLSDVNNEIPMSELQGKEGEIAWINGKCTGIVNKWSFENTGMVEELRIVQDPCHDENYWIENIFDNRFKSHYCDMTYAFIQSLKTHECNRHGHVQSSVKVNKQKDKNDELFDYMVHLFKLVALHKYLDKAVDMGDDYRSVRSAKYETPIYNKTNKTKYLISSIHLTALVSRTLRTQKQEELLAKRFVNLSGGANNNVALDEYVELLNRDTKNASFGYQTKDSIIRHSKEYPHLIDAIKQ